MARGTQATGTPLSSVISGKYSSTVSSAPTRAAASRAARTPGWWRPPPCRPAAWPGTRDQRRRPDRRSRAAARATAAPARPPRQTPTLTHPTSEYPPAANSTVAAAAAGSWASSTVGVHPAVDAGVARFGADRGQPVVEQRLLGTGDERAAEPPQHESEGEAGEGGQQRSTRRSQRPAAPRPRPGAAPARTSRRARRTGTSATIETADQIANSAEICAPDRPVSANSSAYSG